MAGRVLRDSKGRYAGSTRGFGRGRTTHGGGFGNGIKARTRTVRTQRAIQTGRSVGIRLGKGAAISLVGTATSIGLQKAGVSPNRIAVGALAVGVAYQATKKVVRANLRR